MGKFYNSFHQFKKNGFFLLDDATLTLSQLIHLYGYIQKNKSFIETSGREFTLRNVKIYPELRLPSRIDNSPDPVKLINGEPSLNEEQKEDRELIEEIQLLLQIEDKSPWISFQILLTRVLMIVHWKAINLDIVTFHYSKRNCNSKIMLGGSFIPELSSYLKSNPDLRSLSLKDIEIDFPTLTELIKSNTSLEDLQLIPRHTHENRSLAKLLLSDPYSMNEDALEKFMQALYFHPNIKFLLLYIEMDHNKYQQWNALLDNNYRIEDVALLPSAEQAFPALHNKLLLRLIPNAKYRFIKERLSQAALFHLSVDSIINEKFDALNIILDAPNSLLCTGSVEERKIAMHEIKHYLPDVYAEHREHMENAWRHHTLDFSTVLAGDKEPLGIRLLYEAFKKNDAYVIQTLLYHNAKHFNRSPTFHRYLTQKLFESRSNNLWKKYITLYFQENLSLFSAWINKIEPHQDILYGLNALHQHLIQYLNKLLELHHQYYFIRIFKQSPSMFIARKNEWEAQFNDLIKGIQRAEEIEDKKNLKPAELRRESFKALSEHIARIAARARNAELGYWDRSVLHGKEISVICNKLLIDIKSSYAGLEKHDRECDELKKQLAQEKEEKIQMALRIKQLESMLNENLTSHVTKWSEPGESSSANEEQQPNTLRFFSP
ncbi:hypothetical protein [Rickettsiella endosymbiont of Dermanyssus gallinae]|uniref:hypothetical protein n=1 Tax=Rickettsiella endosymbiont of Dermanyssus gallinae TaxID=2856608 RepID=UPI001C53320D|nr:hypothetical protein [Rickettsiella endosymbiont of Dermanyssus gallinae]